MKTRNKLYDKSRLRLLCLLTALLGLFGAGQTWAGTPTTSGTSSTHRGAVVGGTAANIGGGQADNLYFGTYQQSSDGNGGYNIDPIKWRVLENAEGQLFLISDQNLDVKPYNSSSTSITWEKSTIRSWLNGYAASENNSGTDYSSNNFIDAAFSSDEQVAIADTYVYNKNNPSYSTSGSENTTDQIFLLSIEEANNSSYFPNGKDSRKSTNTAYVASYSGMLGAGEADYWWLRSPGEDDDYAAFVDDGGVVYNNGYIVVHTNTAVRPAFNLNLNSVLFTSAAAGGKAGNGLNAVADYDGNEWKLTLLDNSRNFSVTETTVSGYRGTTVTLHYSGATNGTNEYISVLLTDEQGNALYYGRVAEPNSAEGEVSLTIPDALAAGTYTLNVFSEQYNGDYQTDYASAFEAVTMTVHAIPGQLDGVYQIETAEDLFWFAALVNGTLEGTAQNAAACAVLTTNIDLTGADWTPIGNASTIYTGTFDGQNHTISGMTLENAESYSGLFGNVTGTVRDFTVTGSITITGDETVSRVGGAVGSLGTASVGGTVSGVTSGVNITVSAGNDHIGGVVGSMPKNSSPTVENCVYTGDINITVAAGSVAGVVGYIRTGTIQNCANWGGISINTGGNGSVGGILGYCNNSKIYIRNCYNSGGIAAEGTANVGAIVGNNRDDNNHVGQATVSNCYYLTGSADKGQGQLTDDAAGTAVKTDEDFKSGEVACLLQGDQTTQAWGQTLGADNYPVLTTDEAKRVYAAKLYKGSAENVSELYKNASGISSPEEPNALLVIENAPSASTGTNIVVKSGDAYTCANLVLTDGADFYTPVAFTATQATYSRPLADGTQWGTVALPFDATSVTGAELFRVARQEGDALYVDETNGMADGEPLVFRANAEVTTVDFKGTEVAVRATDAEAGSTLLKGTSQTVSPLTEGAYFIYGDKFYRVASGSQVGMKPFRAYIPAAAGASTRSAGAASQLRIVFNASETTRTAHEGK